MIPDVVIFKEHKHDVFQGSPLKQLRASPLHCVDPAWFG